MESSFVNQGIDISSCLPEAVFSNIVSWLPVKEAVRTSVIVKRWKNAWKYVTRLDLDPESIMEPNAENVGRTLQSDNELTSTRHSRADLIHCTRLYTSIIQSLKDEVTYCQIVHFPTNLNRGQLKEWVKELVKRRKVKTLFLKCYEKSLIDRERFLKPLVLPPVIFSALESLELTGYRLLDTSSFRSCKKLRILKLRSLELGRKSIANIFSFCKSLEELSLLYCCGFSNLKISSQNLKFLELRYLQIDNINISAEALMTMILYKISCRWSCVVIDAPRVTEFQAYCGFEGASQEHREIFLSQEKLLECCTGFLSCHERSHPLYSSQVGYVSVFRNLQVLCTSLDLNDIRHAILLSYIFRVCFRLEILDITVEEVKDPCKAGNLNYPENMFWEKTEIFDCICYCLRAVSIQKFRGQVLEMEFVKFLLTRAPRMHRIIIKCDDNCTTEEVTATLSLLSLPKSSMDVAVVIDTPPAGKLALPQEENGLAI